MRTLDKLTAALGEPRALVELGRGKRLLAAVGRWQHNGARVDFSDADTTQLVFNISGGQIVELEFEGRSVRNVIRAGSVAVVAPSNPRAVTVTGTADILQVVVANELIKAATARPASPAPAPLAVSGRRLQAVAAQALVALAHGRNAGRAEIDAIVRRLSPLLSRRDVTPSGPRRGGLAAGARRRVDALMDERLRPGSCSPVPLADLADAAGLSVHHFVKAFRQAEGETPYACVLSRRINIALELLLQTDARVDQVGDATGFSSPSHFVSTFRRHTGVTPGALRDAARAGR